MAEPTTSLVVPEHTAEKSTEDHLSAEIDDLNRQILALQKQAAEKQIDLQRRVAEKQKIQFEAVCKRIPLVFIPIVGTNSRKRKLAYCSSFEKAKALVDENEPFLYGSFLRMIVKESHTVDREIVLKQLDIPVKPE